MYQCTDCKENSVYEYFDGYDNEVYMKCSLCGKNTPKSIFTEYEDDYTDGDDAETE